MPLRGRRVLSGTAMSLCFLWKCTRMDESANGEWRGNKGEKDNLKGKDTICLWYWLKVPLFKYKFKI